MAAQAATAVLKEHEASRAKAWEAYRSLALPDRVAHVWRYTDPAQFLPAEGAENGGFREGLVEYGALPGVEVTDLRTVAPDRLSTLVPPTAGKLEALNAARWHGGLHVRMPRGREAPEPLVLKSTLGANPFNASKTIIEVEDGASLTVVRDYRSAGGAPTSVNGVIEIFAGKDSQVRLVVIEELGREDKLYFSQRTFAERGARVDTVVVSLGGGVVKADVGAILGGPGSDSESWGVVIGGGKQHFDHHTVHEHRSGKTRSNFEYKTILRGEAHSIYTGVIRIDAGAKGCEAYQVNRNLMLDDTAKADSIPELEILNDEVRCTHGATMGPIEPEYIFYLQARGIPKAEATRIFIEGFLEPAFTRLPEVLAAGLRARIGARLDLVLATSPAPAGRAA